MLKRILVVVIAAAFATSVFAQSGADEARIAELEKAVKELQDCRGEGKSMFGCNLVFYGYLRMDAVYTDSKTANSGGGAINFWTFSETSAYDNDDTFRMTARNSRLGLLLNGDENADLKSSGKLEFDFANSNVEGDSETNNTPRIRHAYLQLDIPDCDMSILAGQTWDVIAPVLPPTVDNSVLWFQGDTGMRRTQLRVTKNWGLSEDSSFKLEGALARQIGSNASGVNGLDSGDDSAMPSFQARASMTLPMFNGLKSTFGISGLYGEEEDDTVAGSDDSVKYDSKLLAFDMTVPVSKQTKFVGEIYTGENTGKVGGGIAQTVNAVTGEEIESTGGWVAVSHNLSDSVVLSGGFAQDSVDDGTLSAGGRQSNQTAFANIIMYPLKNVKTGFELASNKTEYQDSDNGDSLRGTFFMQYNF